MPGDLTARDARYPRIRVSGSARERGRQYGEGARLQVQRSLQAYEQVFMHYAGWDWPRVTAQALLFEAPVQAYDERYLEEMAGIAEGAGAAYEDVLALNVRTEIMFSATARSACEGRRVGECSSFALLPPATREGVTLIGQNWDWLPHSFQTVVVLEAEQPDRPDFVTIVEAGLLAKAGMNASGVGLATNALVTLDDKGMPGIPYHVVLRAILDAETITDALSAIQRRPRASAANYLIAHRDGLAIDVETAPGDFSSLWLIHPDQGVLLHTNHFIAPASSGRDVSLWAMPDSAFRLGRLIELVREGGIDDVDGLQRVLADHAGHPFGICCHPDPRAASVHDQSATVVSMVMNLDRGEIWAADGPPCAASFHELGCAGFLAGERSAVAEGAGL
jgi:isopenicillin-N N-acyltransferase like protein